jgi:hypothetical protein
MRLPSGDQTGLCSGAVLLVSLVRLEPSASIQGFDSPRLHSLSHNKLEHFS